MEEKEEDHFFALLENYLGVASAEQSSSDRLLACFSRSDSEMTIDEQDCSRSRRRRREENKASSIESNNKNIPIMRPRILKNDFRRYYANMWCNVFNSCDFNLMIQHLETFYSRDILISQSDVRKDPQYCPSISHFQPQAKGLSYLSKFWFAAMTSAPDLACSLRHTSVKVRADGTSCIRCCFSLKGTQVSEMDPTKREDIERIARYQSYQAHGRKGITITEAAAVAMAPATFVLLQGNSENNGSKRMSTRSSAIRPPLAAATAPAPAELSPGESVSSVDYDSSGISSSSSPSSSPMKVETEAAAWTLLDSSSVGIHGISNSQNSLGDISGQTSRDYCEDSDASCKADKSETLSVMEDSECDEKSICADTHVSSGSTGAGTCSRSDIGSSRQLHAAATTSKPTNRQKGDIDWLALAEYAYKAGTLEPCQPRSQKKYYYSTSGTRASVDSYGRAVSEKGQTDHSTGATTAIKEEKMRAGAGPEKVTIDESQQSHSSSYKQLVQQQQQQQEIFVPMRRTVIAAVMDCICSIELELDADGKIVTLALHYFR